MDIFVHGTFFVVPWWVIALGVVLVALVFGAAVVTIALLFCRK